MQTIRRHLTYANVMATVAVFLALGGGAYAALHLKKNSVGTKQLRNNAVSSAKLKNGPVTGAKITDGAVNGAKIADGAIGIADVSASLHPALWERNELPAGCLHPEQPRWERKLD